ncbi:integral membrane protein AefA [Salmonella enterica subsp. enterica]|uniref:Integral membrane protein AefA n=1 Tax=Salmonella enterica I TaxID=59201 RepID=A0A379WYE5_SALET|nr:integral membrane protein AefA [Salmonella enterica subsp. enterica]
MLMQQNIKVKKLARSRAAVGKKYQRTDCRLKRQPVAVAYLYQQQQTLPSADELEDMTNRIADLRLEQFEINPAA